MRNFVAAMLFIGITVLSSCTKKEDDSINRPRGNAFEQLNVPKNFTWKTHQDVTIRVDGPYSGLVTVKKTDGTPVLKANLTQNSPMTLRFGVPAYEERLTLTYAGRTVEVELTGGQLVYSFAAKTEALDA